MAHSGSPEIWFAAGLRTPFAKSDGPLSVLDPIAMSVPLAQRMVGLLEGGKPDLAVWGTVVPNLTWSNIAREVLLDAGLDPTIPAYATVMACSTSMMGAFQAAGLIDGRERHLALVGGVENLGRIQLGLGQPLSDWIARFQKARTTGQKISHALSLRGRDIKLYVPRIANRTTGMSMGEHTEITAKEWNISRAEQDQIALLSHQRAVAAWTRGFFDDLVLPLNGLARDNIPRADTSLEKLARLQPVFDRTSGRGTLTAGNSSPLTDGAASLWVGSAQGMARLPAATPRARLVDWGACAIDLRHEGLLMAPAYAIPRLLQRQGMQYRDVGLWEIHEAFAAQVAFHIKALESRQFQRDKVGIDADLGALPTERINPNGGSTAIGHPFGATGARILSQAIKELSLRGSGERAIVSICADGGQGTVALLEALA
jgi:acetyl-CoA C-acetyltransferase